MRILRCELCEAQIPADEFIYLSENKLYDEENVYIMENSCLHYVDGNVEVLESYQSLSLVRVEFNNG